MYKLEKSVLTFIKDANKTASAKALKEAFIKLKQAFEALAKDPSEKVMFQYFDFISWADSKINNESFAAAVKKSYELKE